MTVSLRLAEGYKTSTTVSNSDRTSLVLFLGMYCCMHRSALRQVPGSLPPLEGGSILAQTVQNFGPPGDYLQQFCFPKIAAFPSFDLTVQQSVTVD